MKVQLKFEVLHFFIATVRDPLHLRLLLMILLGVDLLLLLLLIHGSLLLQLLLLLLVLVVNVCLKLLQSLHVGKSSSRLIEV